MLWPPWRPRDSGGSDGSGGRPAGRRGSRRSEGTGGRCSPLCRDQYFNIQKQNEMITLKKLRQIEQRLISSKPLRVSSYTFFIEGFKTQKSEAFYIHTGLTPPQPIFWRVNTIPCFRSFEKKYFFFSFFEGFPQEKEGSRKRYKN